MPLFIGALLGGLLQLAGSLTGRVLLALGVSFATYGGFTVLLNWILAEAKTRLNGAPAWTLDIAYLLKIDVCITIIASAFVARLVVAGITSDTLTNMVVKR